MTKTAAPVLNQAQRDRIQYLYQVADGNERIRVHWQMASTGILLANKRYIAKVYVKFWYRGVFRSRVIRTVTGKNEEDVRQRVCNLHSQAASHLLSVAGSYSAMLSKPSLWEEV